MNRTIYVEDAVADSRHTGKILQRCTNTSIVRIDRYTEVFNPKAQNFRLQKKNPALILARKHKNLVLPAPQDYNIGGDHNYYFSHMMNCIYDCRYCFLQGMYQSANHVVFTNFDDFFKQITQTSNQHGDEPVWFFSGYDCDSLALEPVTGFMDACVDYFSGKTGGPSAPANAHLEIRTKSTQIRNLLRRDPIPQCVIAYSLSPHNVAAQLEHKTPTLEKRLQALEKLQKAGWKIGLRFDPLIAAGNFEQLYGELFEQVEQRLDTSRLHSVSLGTFRLPKPFFKKVIKLYPDEPMFAVASHETDGMIAYPPEQESRMLSFCANKILNLIPPDRFFPCQEITALSRTKNESDTQTQG